MGRETRAGKDTCKARKQSDNATQEHGLQEDGGGRKQAHSAKTVCARILPECGTCITREPSQRQTRLGMETGRSLLKVAPLSLDVALVHDPPDPGSVLTEMSNNGHLGQTLHKGLAAQNLTRDARDSEGRVQGCSAGLLRKGRGRRTWGTGPPQGIVYSQ